MQQLNIRTTMWRDTLERVSCNDHTLKWIDAMCFLLGDQGCEELAGALMSSKNRFITRLNLRLNCIGWAGMKSLTDALIFNPSLIIDLNLGSNELHDEGAYQVARLLENNQTLSKVWVFLHRLYAV